MTDSAINSTKQTMQALSASIKNWGLALGFNHIGITDTDLHEAEARHEDWIKKG